MNLDFQSKIAESQSPLVDSLTIIPNAEEDIKAIAEFNCNDISSQVDAGIIDGLTTDSVDLFSHNRVTVSSVCAQSGATT